MVKKDFVFEELFELVSQYGCRVLEEPRVLTGGEDNLNLLVRTDQGPIVVRRYDLSALQKVEVELRLVNYLASSSFPTPAPLQSNFDEFVVVWNERPTALFPFVSGSTPKYSSVGLWEQIGELMAKLHLLGDKWDGELAKIDRAGFLERVISESSGLSDWQIFCDDVTSLLKQDRVSASGDWPNIPVGPLHHDVHKDNILVNDGGELIALLDFDECNTGPFVLDLVRACHYIAAESKDFVLDPQFVRSLFTGYQRNRSLTDREQEIIPFLFDLANLFDAAAFFDSSSSLVRSALECFSYQIFLRNRKFNFTPLTTQC